MIKLDAIDIKLIEELQTDAKQSIKELAAKVNLSITPTHERIKKIEANNIIDRYVAIVKPKAVDKFLIVYCHVTLIKHQPKYFSAFETHIKNMDEIVEVAYIAGNYDVYMKIILKNMEDYQGFIMHKMSNSKIISNIHSSFVLKHVKNETKIPIT